MCLRVPFGKGLGRDVKTLSWVFGRTEVNEHHLGALFSPRSVDGSKKWHNGPEKRRTVFEQWYTTCTAYLILSTPKLKAQYDIERLVFLDEEAKRKASPMGFVVEMQLAYRIVHNVN